MMKTLGLSLMCLALALALTACAAAAPKPSPSPTTGAMTSPLPGVSGSPEIFPSPTDHAAATSAMTGPESAALSKKANESAVKISEIDSCVTAILGDTCLAGVTFDPRYQGALTDRIRDMVTSRIQSVAPEVKRVAVTSNPEIAAQIGSVAEKIGKASTLGELTVEFDAVLGRM